jgi:hypothetical protein
MFDHKTDPGYKHIPAGGLHGQILRWDSDGEAQWDDERICIAPSNASITLFSNSWDPIMVNTSFTLNQLSNETIVISHDSSAGSKHIPAGGSNNQILRWSADGTAQWSNESAGGSGEMNVQADWAETSTGSDAYIRNKPTVGETNVQANWTEGSSSSDAYIRNKPTIGTGSVGITAGSGLSGGGSFNVNQSSNSSVTISHETGSGHNHVPSGGSTGDVLKWGGSGVAVWGAESGGSSGDMLKTTYDTNNNGKVDVSENSEHFDGKSRSDFIELGVTNSGNYSQSYSGTGSAVSINHTSAGNNASVFISKADGHGACLHTRSNIGPGILAATENGSSAISFSVSTSGSGDAVLTTVQSGEQGRAITINDHGAVKSGDNYSVKLSSDNRIGIGVVATSDNNAGQFINNSGIAALVGFNDGSGYGIKALSSSGTPAMFSDNGYSQFTGVHVGMMSGTFDIGDIVKNTTVYRRIGISDVMFDIETTISSNDKQVCGVITGTTMQDGEDVEDTGSLIGTKFVPNGNILHYYNAIGEGQVNVCGQNGNIEAGDLITTSDVTGKGMKQDDNIVRAHTVGKARESVTFSSPDEVKMIACIYMCG